jgi:FixJ family two-component response regulator
LGQVRVITIIDDDVSVRVATNRLVRSLGYSTHAFASADEFLRSPQLNATSCVITDIHMPGMDGVELQSYLRAQGSRLPIIFITAFPDESVRARALDGGAVALLTKPFDVATLIKCLDVALGRTGGGIGD